MLQALAREDDAHAHGALCVLIVLQLMNRGQNLVVWAFHYALQLLRANMHQTHANAHPYTLSFHVADVGMCVHIVAEHVRASVTHYKGADCVLERMCTQAT